MANWPLSPVESPQRILSEYPITGMGASSDDSNVKHQTRPWDLVYLGMDGNFDGERCLFHSRGTHPHPLDLQCLQLLAVDLSFFSP